MKTPLMLLVWICLGIAFLRLVHECSGTALERPVAEMAVIAGLALVVTLQVFGWPGDCPNGNRNAHASRWLVMGVALMLGSALLPSCGVPMDLRIRTEDGDLGYSSKQGVSGEWRVPSDERQTKSEK